MAVNPSDTRYAISKETVAGTTNATPAFLVLDYMALRLSMNQIGSNRPRVAQTAHRLVVAL